MNTVEDIQKLVGPALSESMDEWRAPLEITRGVYLLRMPMPFRLDHINLYILEDTQGWTLVDCGLNNAESMAVWNEVFARFLGDKPVTRIIVTHLHPDHIGLADWLQCKTKAPIYITSPEWELATALFELPTSDPARLSLHYQRLGLMGDRLQKTIKQASSFRTLIKKLPAKVNILNDREVLSIGGRRWQIFIGRGHSPANACLWDESERVLIAGDHILPSITPNINLLTVGPSNPLDDSIKSLKEFRGVPCDLILPAHGSPTPRYRERIDELLGHHATHLDCLHAACTEERTASDCVPFLFDSELPDHQFYFAIGESAAHLTYLAQYGRLKRTGDIPWKFVQP